MSVYPEHDKLRKIADKSQVCGEFIDWLESRGIVLCEIHRRRDEFLPTQETLQALLAAFFDIDQKRIDAEKEEMLDDIRKMYA